MIPHNPERAPQTRRVESLGRPTHALVTAANVLSDLRETYMGEARHVRLMLSPEGEPLAAQLDREAETLDAMRTRLVQEGEDELDLALAYIDAGRSLYRSHVLAGLAIRMRREAAEEVGG